MAWENYQVEKQRLDMVDAYRTGLFSMTELCKKYGISRKTGYKWCHRFAECGKDGLLDRSTAPRKTPTLYTQELLDIAIDLKLRKRTWGPKKILAKLKDLYPELAWPSNTRLYEIFKELHLVNDRKLRGRVPATAPLGHISSCNDTWAVDLKGWFLTADGQKCEPLTITDCHSRYLIRCEHLKYHSVEYVWPVFYEAFMKYGLPIKVRSDNGPPFGSVGVGRLTRLGVKIIKAGVIPEWINPGHPEENGRHERFHLTLKQDVATPPKDTLALQIKALFEFCEEYNFDRPHEALNMKVPADCYQQSPRRWDGILRPPEYNTSEVQVRKVGPSGCMWFKGQEVYIGDALVGEYVGVKPDEIDGLGLYYGPIFLGKLDKGGLERPRLRARRQR
jgi:putative transposase